MRKSQVRARNTGTVALSTLTHGVLNGQLNAFPKIVTLDLENANAADYQALLQLVRHRSFGHQVLKAEPGASPMQEVRTKINSGRFTEALKLAESLDKKDPEVIIEIARAKVFLGRFLEVPDLLAPVVNELNVSASSRGVAAQLRGHALIEAGLLAEAEHSLQIALTLARSSENVLGNIAANFFLSRIFAFQGNFEETFFVLNQAMDDILRLGSFRWLLGYYRHLSHTHFLAGDMSCILEAQAGILLARALQDDLFEFRGVLETELMARKFGIALDLGEIREKMRLYAEKSESDLSLWMGYVFNDLPPQTYFARRMVQESKTPPIDLHISSSFNLHQNCPWIYDRKNQVIVDLKSSTFSTVSVNGPLGKIISVLHSREESMSASDLFEQVWNLSWSPERHQNILDVTLHRFNKISDSLKVIRVDSTVRLSCSGLIL